MKFLITMRTPKVLALCVFVALFLYGVPETTLALNEGGSTGGTSGGTSSGGDYSGNGGQDSPSEGNSSGPGGGGNTGGGFNGGSPSGGDYGGREGSTSGPGGGANSGGGFGGSPSGSDSGREGSTSGPGGGANSSGGFGPGPSDAPSATSKAREAADAVSKSISGFFSGAAKTASGILGAAAKALNSVGISTPSYTSFSDVLDAALDKQKQDIQDRFDDQNPTISSDDLSDIGVEATPSIVGGLADNKVSVTVDTAALQGKIDEAAAAHAKALQDAKDLGVTGLPGLPSEIAAQLETTHAALEAAKEAKIAAEYAAYAESRVAAVDQSTREALEARKDADLAADAAEVAAAAAKAALEAKTKVPGWMFNETIPTQFQAPVITDRLFTNKVLDTVTITAIEEARVISVPAAKVVGVFNVYDTAKIDINPAVHSFVPTEDFTPLETAKFIDVQDDLKAMMPLGTDIYATYRGFPVMSPAEVALVGKFDITRKGLYSRETELAALEVALRGELPSATLNRIAKGTATTADLTEVAGIVSTLVNRAVSQNTSIADQVNKPSQISSVTVDGRAAGINAPGLAGVVGDLMDGTLSKQLGLTNFEPDDLAYASHYYSPSGIAAQTGRTTPSGWDIDFNQPNYTTAGGHVFGNVAPASGIGHEYSVAGRSIDIDTTAGVSLATSRTTQSDFDDGSFSFSDENGNTVTVNADGTGTVQNGDTQTSLSSLEVSKSYFGESYSLSAKAAEEARAALEARKDADLNPNAARDAAIAAREALEGRKDADLSPSTDDTDTVTEETEDSTVEKVTATVKSVANTVKDTVSGVVDSIRGWLGLEKEGKDSKDETDDNTIIPRTDGKLSLENIEVINVHFGLNIGCHDLQGVAQNGYVYKVKLKNNSKLIERIGCGLGTPQVYAEEIAADLEKNVNFAPLDVDALFSKMTFKFYASRN